MQALITPMMSRTIDGSGHVAALGHAEESLSPGRVSGLRSLPAAFGLPELSRQPDCPGRARAQPVIPYRPIRAGSCFRPRRGRCVTHGPPGRLSALSGVPGQGDGQLANGYLAPSHRLSAVCRQHPARRCPALGTGPGGPAIPPDVIAPVSAVRHHLAGIQPDPAHPAGNDTGPLYAAAPLPGGHRVPLAMTLTSGRPAAPSKPPAGQARPVDGSTVADGRITRILMQRLFGLSNSGPACADLPVLRKYLKQGHRSPLLFKTPPSSTHSLRISGGFLI